MTKGNYDLNNYNAGGHPPNDTSFRNCICAMLVFIGMCAIIAIVAVVMHSDSSKKAEESGVGPSADAAHGKGFTTTTTRSAPHPAHPPHIPFTTTTKRTEIPIMPTTPHKVTDKVVVDQSSVAPLDGNKDSESIPETKNTTKTGDRKQPYVVWTEVKEEDERDNKTVGDKDLSQTTASPLNKTVSTEKVFIVDRFGGKESDIDNVTKTSGDKQHLVPTTEGNRSGNKTIDDKDLSQTTASPLNKTVSTEKVFIVDRFGGKESEINNVTKTSGDKQHLVPTTEATNQGKTSGNKTTGYKILPPILTNSESTSEEYSSSTEDRTETESTSDFAASSLYTTEEWSTELSTTEEGLSEVTSEGYGSSLMVSTEELISSSEYPEFSTTEELSSSSEYPEFSTIEELNSSSEYPEFSTTEELSSSSEYPEFSTIEEVSTSSEYPEISTIEELNSSSEYPEFSTTKELSSSSEYPEFSTIEELNSSSEYPEFSTTEELNSSSEYPEFSTPEELSSSSEYPEFSTIEELNSSSEYPEFSTIEELNSSSEYPEFSTTDWLETTENLVRNQVIVRNLTEKKRSSEEEEEEEEEDETATDPDFTVTGEWSGDPSDGLTTSANVMECKPKACAVTVSRLFGLMDLSAEPCDDFYGYSCGSKEEDHSEDEYRNGVRDHLYDVLEKGYQSGPINYAASFRTFYNSCMQHESVFYYRSRVDTAKKIVKDLGSFILDSKAVVDKSSLTKLLAKLVLTKSFPLLKADIAIKEDLPEYILKLTLPDRDFKSDTVLSDWPTWLADERHCRNAEEPSEKTINLSDLYNSFKTCRNQCIRYAMAFENVLAEMDFFEGLKPYNVTQKINEFVFTLEMDVMKQVESIGADEMRRREAQQGYEDVMISDLQTACDAIDWLLFYEELTGITASPYTTIRIFFYDKIKAVLKRLKPKGFESTLYNILLTMYATDIYQNTVLPKHTQDRRQYCLELSNHFFQDVSTRLYLTSSTISELRQQDKVIRGMFDLLRDDLIQAFNSAEWFEGEDKDELIDKANRLDVALGTSTSDCIDQQVLARKYDIISKDIGENFMRNLLLLMENRERSILSLAGSTFDQGQIFCHFLHPFDTEPKSFGANIIAVPYGAVGKIPADVPGYILVARLGLHLAQEIANHFDPTIIKKHMSLSEEFFDTYNQVLDERIPIPRTRMVNQHFVEFTTTNFTIDKEVSDRTALRLVSDVFDKWQNNLDLPWIQKNFTRKQIFFITVAQEFCRKVNIIDYMLGVYENGALPYPIRAEMMLVNSEKFTNVFECPGGTRMKTEEVGKAQFPYLDELFDSKKRRKRSWFATHH